MSEGLVTVSYIASTILFILSLGGLSNPETSRRGNAYGVAGMAIAILATLLGPKVSSVVPVIMAMAIGGSVGIIAAQRVQMTQMPELVALMHSLVGLAAVLIGSAVMVVTSRNPVHSVLFLILAFFNAAGLFLIAGAEFLAMILVIVYVGAVAVLFLFVVMMLDIDFARLREGFQRYAPVGALIGLVLLVQLVMVMISWRMAPGAMALRLNETPSDIPNAQALGRILYTDYIYLFQGCGLILLVAWLGRPQLPGT